MRNDHLAYQRATRVAGFGLLLQILLALTLFLFGQLAGGGDVPFKFAAYYVAVGLPVWLSLMVVFHQHKLERLEALEEDELAASRGGSGSVFESEETRLAARRLRGMHKWLMPIVSLVVAAALALGAWLIIAHFRRLVDAGDPLQLAGDGFAGWALAICIAAAVICFIFSRFVAGMAKVEAWQNLRGGAGYMVGNALVMLALGVGVSFRAFQNDQAIFIITRWVLSGFMLLAAAEIVLNFILNLYRPRVAGETPRPAFDSRVLSLLAAPDSLVRSLNEAINYQFGFDITSSWGYQLLLRSFVWLVVFALLVAVVLNTMVVVEPHQRAIRLRWGEAVTDPSGEPHVYGSGIMWKWPWPIETALVQDVTRIRALPLTAQRVRRGDIDDWSRELQVRGTLDPFIVISARHDVEMPDSRSPKEAAPASVPVSQAMDETAVAAQPETVAEQKVTTQFALIDAEIVLQYRIADDPAGFRQFLRFAPATGDRRSELNMRERALQALALREVSERLSQVDLDDALSEARTALAAELAERIQAAYDRAGAGVRVVSVAMPLVRPSGMVAQNYDALDADRQTRMELVSEARMQVARGLAFEIGDPSRADQLIAEISEWERARDEFGLEDERTLAQRIKAEQLINQLGGNAANVIAAAQADRWRELMEVRALAREVKGQQESYRASPRLYRQRQVMELIGRALKPLRKYVIGIDPSRLNVNVEFTELDPFLATVLTPEDEGQGATNP